MRWLVLGTAGGVLYGFIRDGLGPWRGALAGLAATLFVMGAEWVLRWPQRRREAKRQTVSPEERAAWEARVDELKSRTRPKE